MQPIFQPCRSSTTRTNSAACIIEAWVPVSSHAVPRVEHGDGQLAPPQVLVVDRGDLELAAGARL